MKKIVLMLITFILLGNIIITENVKAEPPITINGFIYIDGAIKKPQAVRITFPSNSKNGITYENGSYHIVNITGIKNGETGIFNITYNGKLYTPPETVTREDNKNYYTVNLHINVTPVADASGPYIGTKCDSIHFIGSANNGLTPYTWDWDFGDGSEHSNLQNPTHQYINDDSYIAILTVTDSVGTADTDTAQVTITTPALVADAAGLYTSTKCIAVNFTGYANGGCPSYNWDWDFGDGSEHSNLQNPSHHYSNDGNYFATLTVTDKIGMTDNDTASVTISTPTLVADANGPYEGVIGVSISFEGSASGGCKAYEYSWNFGDGTTSTQQNPTHTYTTTGTKTVTLTVTSDSKTDTDTTQATINPTSTITADAHGPYTGYTNTAIQFTGSATGGTTYTWNWNFGDGTTSTQQNPTHTYTTTGTKTVTLTVTSNSHTISDTASVSVITKPFSINDAQLTADAGGPYYEIIDVPIQFDGSKSYNKNGAILTYKWSFGDGNANTSITPTHTYTKEGNYTIKLTVTDDKNKTDTDITYAIITKKPNHPPETPTISGINSTHINTTCNYSIKGSDIDDDKIQYIINWSDRTNQTISPQLKNGTVFNTSHSWSTAGVYIITVYTLDENNATSDKQNYTVLIDIDAHYCGSLGYLIDKNGDGNYDVFYNQIKGKETNIQKNNSEYYIDINDDLQWDYKYNIITNKISEYNSSSKQESSKIIIEPKFIILTIIAIIIIIFLIIILKNLIKRKNETPKEIKQEKEPLLKTKQMQEHTQTNKIYSFYTNDEKTKKMHKDIDKILTKNGK